MPRDEPGAALKHRPVGHGGKRVPRCLERRQGNGRWIKPWRPRTTARLAFSRARILQGGCLRLALHWPVEHGDAADAMSGPEHTYAKNCLHCGDGRTGTHCDLSGYSARRIRFILAHRDAFNAAYLDPNLSAASNELERLSREYITLPHRPDCSCRCPNEQRGRPRCMECVRLDAQRPSVPGARRGGSHRSYFASQCADAGYLDARSRTRAHRPRKRW
jgi:hypothetical protein